MVLTGLSTRSISFLALDAAVDCHFIFGYGVQINNTSISSAVINGYRGHTVNLEMWLKQVNVELIVLGTLLTFV